MTFVYNTDAEVEFKKFQATYYGNRDGLGRHADASANKNFTALLF